MMTKQNNMKKIVIILFITLFFLSNAYAGSDNIKINGIDFHLPPKYQGGELYNDEYKLDNIFSIRCIDDNIITSIGLWAEEKELYEDININNHPVRHFSQYNKYVNGNHSHAYFASGNSVYEIAWTGEKINRDIENLIKNTPKSEINDDNFYNALDESYDIYKQQKIDKLNQDAQYNYLEAQYQSKLKQQEYNEEQINKILYTYYLNA